jgi:hypothetical protein
MFAKSDQFLPQCDEMKQDPVSLLYAFRHVLEKELPVTRVVSNEGGA